MQPFMIGFCDELTKLGGVIGSAIGAPIKGGLAVGKGVGKRVGKQFLKHPLIYGLTGLGAYTGYQAAKKPKTRKIMARPGQPSPAFYIDYYKALGRPVKKTKAQLKRESIHFAKYREKK